ncbi:hypothetical protein GGR50DRAFT_192972 [Xylaria sp. CBS 124048]|nr:hypothetical protein GGR50DRAFT_192972 [Xylaria sp. CBS 124048]
MSLRIHDLSDELVVDLTRVLARRPEYGIARPSRKWLLKQEEKLRALPKELLKPTNVFKRIASKIAGSLDSSRLSPPAVLCGTHASLNPFLIRRLFVALAYEVTVFTDPLRLWKGKNAIPELSDFVGRLDSITALWTEPELFRKIYGQAPFDEHHIYVESSCEACCLAAVGASGRALADLRAALIDRSERRVELELDSGKGSSGKTVGKEPRLRRFVEAWIDHLRKRGEKAPGRPEKCRAQSENVLTDLRAARPDIIAWRAEQRDTQGGLRAAGRPRYSELRRTTNGAIIASLPSEPPYKRRTRNGIPVALADAGGADAERKSSSARRKCESIYRPDSTTGFSEIGKQREATHHPLSRVRSRASESIRASGGSYGRPTDSFLHRFEEEIPLNDEGNVDGQGVGDAEERDYQGLSQNRLQDWYSSQVGETDFDNDTKTVLSMVHPAFRSNAGDAIATASALPEPLRVEKGRSQHSDAPPRPASAWTDCTVYTANGKPSSPTTKNAPPVPRVPSKYGDSPIERSNAPHFTEPFASSSKPGPTSSAWPAPPQGLPTKKSWAGFNQSVIAGSDVESKFSTMRQDFLKERFRVKEDPVSPLTRPVSSRAAHSNGAPSRRSSAVPSLSSYGGSVAGSESTHRSKKKFVPRPAIVEDDSDEDDDDEYAGYELRDDVTELKPDDSASNVRWHRSSVSSVTQLGVFKDRM